MWFWILYLLTLGAIPHVLLTSKRPVSQLLWVIAIVFVPFVGFVFYLGIGTDRMRRQRLRRRKQVVQHTYISKPVDKADCAAFGLTPEECTLVRAVTTVNQTTLAAVNSLENLLSADAFYDRLLQDIREARHHIHWEMYVWRNDETSARMLEALADAARRGVKVRVMVDELGSWGTKEEIFRSMREAGGLFSWFFTVHPRRNRFFFNLRNHRKLQVIDGRIAYIGGMNVGLEYTGRHRVIGDWRDYQMRMTGPIVREFQQVFLNDWYFSTQEEFAGEAYFPPIAREPGAFPGVIVESGPDCLWQPFLKSLVALANHAQERLDLCTPYFVPDMTLLHALELCAARGVRVRLMISEKNDVGILVPLGRSFYEPLMRFGVEIYEYSDAVNHAKLAIADATWLLAGSANLDVRSLRLNFELNALVKSPEVCAELGTYYGKMFEACRRVDPPAFLKRPLSQRLKEGACRLVAPLL
jgi:cardiolipin synthase